MLRSVVCRFGRYVMLAAGLLTLLFAVENMADGIINKAVAGIAFGMFAWGVCILSWYLHLRVPKKWCGHDY